MNRLMLLALAAALSTVVACAKMTVITQVEADGQWSRRTIFAVNQEQGPDGKRKQLEDYFVVPGEGWEVTRELRGNELKVTATRAFAAGETLAGDVHILQEGGATIVNEVTVRRLAGNRLEYREVLRWQGERPELDEFTIDRDKVEELRRALGDAANEEQLQAIVAATNQQLRQLFTDPQDPLFNYMFSHPDLMGYRLERRMRVALDGILQEELGLEAEQRAALLDELLAHQDLDGRADQGPEEGSGSGDGDGEKDLLPIAFVVSMPGRVVDCNGRVDEETHDVFWPLYASMIAIGDLELFAICELEE